MTEHAFPMVAHDDPLYGGRIEGQRGMTLRDYFAAAALQALLAFPDRAYAGAAADAYKYADAMLKARAALEEKDTV